MIEFLKIAAEILTPVAAIIAAVMTIVFAFFRKGDNKDKSDLKDGITRIENALSQMPAIENCLQTIADGFEQNVTHEQAKNLLEMAFHTARLVVRGWVGDWFRDGRPAFGGQWNIEQVIKSEFYATRTRVRGYAYKDNEMTGLLDQGEYTFIQNALSKTLPVCADEQAAKNLVDTEFSNVYDRTLERLDAL